MSRDETGSTILLWCLLVTGLLTMVAIVIDLGSIRLDRRAERLAADDAATAGAVVVAGTDGPHRACTAAWTYALRNLGRDPTTPSPCDSSIPTGTVCDPTQPLSATGTTGGYEITIANSVPATSALMRAESIGGDPAQAVNGPTDGQPCDRVAVDIRYTRRSFFAGIIGINQARTDVHSVARYTGTGGPPTASPGLIALDPHGCPTIDAGTGSIEVGSNGAKPGAIYADSDAAAGCSGNHVMDVKNSGHIWAEPAAAGDPGVLGYAAPATVAFNGGLPGSYMGEPTYIPPTGQGPVDAVYHCSVARPACPPSDDAIATVAAAYATGVPAASTTFPGQGQNCNNPPSVFGPGTWYINCNNFQVKNQQVRFQGGTVVFAGGISIGSGGTLVVNTEVNGSGTPVLDATGLPVVAAPGNDALVVVQGGIDLQSSGATMVMAQTTLYQTTGGMNLQGGPHVNWSSPVGGGLKNLLYWNESGGQLTVQGTPDFHGDGIFFLPESLLSIQGNGVLDATGVQFWVGQVETQGASVFRLKPNSKKSVHVGGPGSRLIR